MRGALNFLSTVCVLGTVALVALTWKSTPQEVPTHFNGAGDPDGWGSRNTLLLFPVLSALLYLLFSLLERHAERLNYPVRPAPEALPQLHEQGRDMLVGLKTTMTLLFLYLTAAILLVAHGRASGIGFWFVPLLLLTMLFQVVFHLVRMSRVGRS